MKKQTAVAGGNEGERLNWRAKAEGWSRAADQRRQRRASHCSSSRAVAVAVDTRQVGLFEVSVVVGVGVGFGLRSSLEATSLGHGTERRERKAEMQRRYELEIELLILSFFLFLLIKLFFNALWTYMEQWVGLS